MQLKNPSQPSYYKPIWKILCSSGTKQRKITLCLSEKLNGSFPQICKPNEVN